MGVQILLHKQPLTELQRDKLEAEGVIAIHTKRPEDFKLLDMSVPMIQMNEMVWALLDCIDSDAYGDASRKRFVKNMSKLATENLAKKTTGGG
jgi:hypothetical protein